MRTLRGLRSRHLQTLVNITFDQYQTGITFNHLDSHGRKTSPEQFAASLQCLSSSFHTKSTTLISFKVEHFCYTENFQT